VIQGVAGNVVADEAQNEGSYGVMSPHDSTVPILSGKDLQLDALSRGSYMDK
jgi:hypothetical protein